MISARTREDLGRLVLQAAEMQMDLTFNPGGQATICAMLRMVESVGGIEYDLLNRAVFEYCHMMLQNKADTFAYAHGLTDRRPAQPTMPESMCQVQAALRGSR
jgi:hypothetical protein